MALNLLYKDEPMNSLVEIAMQGHFLLFMDQWTDEVLKHPIKVLSKKDRLKAKDIIKRLNAHRNLERKKIIIMSLADEERSIFVRAFLEIVENKILDKRPGIH